MLSSRLFLLAGFFALTLITACQPDAAPPPTPDEATDAGADTIDAANGDDAPDLGDAPTTHPCDATPQPCAQGACTPLGDAYTCTCSTGFTLSEDGAPTCVDVDECAGDEQICGPGTCTNTEGSYQCACPDGWRPTADGRSCEDIDECAEDERSCRLPEPSAPQGTCVNIVGTFQCVCPAGTRPSADLKACESIDECAETPDLCDDSAFCLDTPEGYTCSPCPEGQQPGADGCVDRNECEAAQNPCGDASGTVCTNLPDGNGYTCTCPDGFTSSEGPRPSCLDVNECATNNGGCSQTCLNTLGAFTCACGAGFELDADRTTCRDIDECATANGGCHAQATCANIVGGRTCTCDPGYVGDGIQCADLDECALDNGGCDPVATCNNLDGTYTCACPDTHCGDGWECQDISACTPPGPPSAVLAEPRDGAVLLTWTASPGATLYTIARAQTANGPFADVGQTTGAAFLDPGVTNRTTYWYVVTAQRDDLTSSATSPVEVTPLAPPLPPTAIDVISQDAQVTLTWTPGTDATRTEILRAQTQQGPFTAIATTAQGTYLDASLTNGQPYWYTLRSLNPVATSTQTSAEPAIPIAPPANLAAVPSDALVSLFWQTSTGATMYRVERATQTAGPWAEVGTTTVPRYSDSGLVNQTTYFYRVRAENTVATSAPGAPTSATPDTGLTPLPPPDDPTQNHLGMNVWFVKDWDRSFAFADAMRHARPWQDGANWQNPVAGVDDLGWPTADASTVLFAGLPDDFNGTYKLSFEGQATVSTMWCPGSVTNQVYDPATNTTTADVTYAMTQEGAVGIIFRDTRRTPSSPLNSGFTNARLWRPGYPTDGSALFTTPFLDALAPAGTLRLMDWTQINVNVVQTWDQRVTPAHATQAGLTAPTYTAADGRTYEDKPLGVALEHQIQLCNALMADCWLNVPILADDTYIQNMALALRFGTDGVQPYTSPQVNPVYPPLNPALKIYVEYANEIWNSAAGFDSFRLIEAIASHLPASHPLLTPLPGSVYQTMWRYPAWKTYGISEIFRTVFGDNAMLTRVRPILMTQRGNANNTLGEALTWLEAFLQTLPTPLRIDDVLYGAGGSGYYGVNSPISADPDTFFAPDNYPEDRVVRDWAIDSIWTHNYGIERVAYEGGPGLYFGDFDNRTLNDDPRMQTMVEDMHDVWSALGGGLLVYYTVRGPSNWEFTGDIQDATSPKLSALQALNARPRAAATLGPALPGIIAPKAPNTHFIYKGYGYALTIEGQQCEAGRRPGDFLAFGAHADAAYSSTLTLNGYSHVDTRVEIWINGTYQGDVSLPAASGPRAIYTFSSLPVQVPEGPIALQLRVAEGDLTVCSIEL